MMGGGVCVFGEIDGCRGSEREGAPASQPPLGGNRALAGAPERMIIVAHMGSDLKEYSQRYLPRLQGEGGEELVPRVCPGCSGEGMHRHGYQSRQLVVPDDGRYEIEVLRMRCPDCGGTHTVLPYFAIPYHTYGARTIMQALRLYVQHGSYRLVQRILAAVKSRAVVRQWVRRFTGVLRELVKGCQRLMADHGVFTPVSEFSSSGSDPPVARAMKLFTGAASRLKRFLTERVCSPILPGDDLELLGWVHLVLMKTDHLVV